MKRHKKYRTNEIFVPGGLPTFTYNPRTNLELEEKLKEANDNLCKLVMMTGSTKSGKTVLTNNVFPRNECIWFEGGSYSTEDELWIEIAQQLDIFPDKSISESSERSNDFSAKGGAGTQLLLFKIKGETNYKHGRKKGKSSSQSRKGNPKTLAISVLRDKNIPLIIDDFHYLPREIQGQTVRAIKSLIFNGLPVVFIAIPHRRLDAVKVEKEMTGRILPIEVPSWSPEELKEIPDKGFPLLNVDVNDLIIDSFLNEAIGSPHLMQEFCRELCIIHQIKETKEDKITIQDIEIEALFKKVALNTGKVIFDKLSKGPRQRADRLQRTLINGITTDIYGLVLYALSEIEPGLDTIHYEELRTKIKEVSVDIQPQAHEITRVLDKMSQIATSDESSTPVIDWEKDERILHITDPFFAYYLRWGIDK
jgi:hypothetical protein